MLKTLGILIAYRYELQNARGTLAKPKYCNFAHNSLWSAFSISILSTKVKLNLILFEKLMVSVHCIDLLKILTK